MPHYVDAILEYERTHLALKSMNKDLNFDLEETRKWAVAAQLELDALKVDYKAMKEKADNLQNMLNVSRAETEAVKLELEICVKEKEALYNALCPEIH